MAACGGARKCSFFVLTIAVIFCAFYTGDERESFLPFADQSMKLFRRVADIKRLFTQFT